MKIRTPKWMIVTLTLIFTIAPGVYAIFFLEKYWTYFFGFLGVLTFLFIVMPWMRIIEIDENGCTIFLLNFKKTYKWNDMEVIREDWLLVGRTMYTGIVFSTKKYNKNDEISHIVPNSMDFFKDFYVCYINDNTKKINYPPYAVEKKEILSKLESWGIAVEKGKDLIRHEEILRRTKIRERRKNR